MSTDQEFAFDPAPPERPAWPAMRRGWRQRCPNCGTGPVFERFLKLRTACPACAEDLSHARADDGPAYLSVLITGKILGPAMLAFYTAFRPEPLVLAAIFGIGATVMALYLLPRLKGMIVGIQWAKRLHGF